MSRSDHPIGVVGGGLAGTVFSMVLARAGLSVLLVEKDRFPRDKLCGEFLSPESTAALDAVGAWTGIAAWAPPTLNTARFTTSRGKQTRFRLSQAGFGVSRYRLDAYLWQQAQECGVQTLRGTVHSVEAVPEGGHRLLVQTDGEAQTRQVSGWVGAFGRHSRMDAHWGGRRAKSGRWVGIKRHHRDVAAADLGSAVEIHSFAGGYCGVNRVEGDRVNVCALVTSMWAKRAGPKDRWFEAMAEANPLLARRLAGLEPDPERSTLAVSAIDFARFEPCRDGVPLLGDAAAMIAPLAGDGQGMALTSATMLAESILQSGPEEAMERWAVSYRRRFKARLQLGRALQGALLHPWGAECLVGACRLVPGLGTFLAERTRERAPVRPSAAA